MVINFTVVSRKIIAVFDKLLVSITTKAKRSSSAEAVRVGSPTIDEDRRSATTDGGGRSLMN